VEQRQSHKWKALESQGSVERCAMVGEKQFLGLMMSCALEEKEENISSARASDSRRLQGMMPRFAMVRASLRVASIAH
jgi:hypothetical protein